MEENSIFQDLWGGNEKVYSAIIAQRCLCFHLSIEFVKKCNIPSTAQITSIVTEEVLSSKDQIDIFIRYDEPSAGKNKPS